MALRFLYEISQHSRRETYSECARYHFVDLSVRICSTSHPGGNHVDGSPQLRVVAMRCNLDVQDIRKTLPARMPSEELEPAPTDDELK